MGDGNCSSTATCAFSSCKNALRCEACDSNSCPLHFQICCHRLSLLLRLNLRVKEVGIGVFTPRKTLKDTTIALYFGEYHLLGVVTAETRAYSILLKDRDFGRNEMVPSTEVTGGVARFLCYSCETLTRLEEMRSYDGPVVAVVACQDIPVGAEIAVYYGAPLSSEARGQEPSPPRRICAAEEPSPPA